ncbi:hypothetical protein FKB34_14035 [Glycocaulis profundi]|jgi:hypothetical protein|nr:hypothetical protein FKB34_14035 [Glycocaulis profundi]
MIKAINILGVIVAALLLMALYIAKTDANAAQDRLARLQTELAQERGRINTLTANIAHLEDPENLRALARAHLGFEPVRPAQEVTLADLAAARAAREREEEAGQPQAATAGFARTATGGAPRP